MHILLANFTKMVNDSGGLAKVTCSFANEMIKRGHEVSLLHSDERRGSFFYHVDDNVQLYNLKESLDGKIIKVPLYIKALREVLRVFSKRRARTVNSFFEENYLLDNLKYYLSEIDPDIIISSQPAASKMLLCDLGISIPVITMSHGDPEDYFHTYPKAELPSLAKSAVCQVLMPSYEHHIKDHEPAARTVTIGNAIPQFEFSARLSEDKEQYKIIFVGRLTKNHKRPHLLLQAFAKLAARYPQWIVELWGMEDRKAYMAELKSIIAVNGLQERAFINGAIAAEQVPLKLREADIFAFPSAFEGFGMALAEGMSVGLPAVGYKNCPAVNELIRNGENGILCDDGVEAFAQALDRLMGDKNLRIKMGKAAKADMAQFAPEQIWNQWEELIRKVAAEERKRF